MRRIEVMRSLILTILSVLLPSITAAQLGPEPFREIKLPVPISRGSFGGKWNSGTGLFQMRIAPDQSVLVFDPDASGEWLLFRVRDWWTGKPSVDLLKIPAWQGGDTLGLYSTSLQVVPGGRYAIAFASGRQIEPRKRTTGPLPLSDTLAPKTATKPVPPKARKTA
jgi:hypothetical protein